MLFLSCGQDSVYEIMNMLEMLEEKCHISYKQNFLSLVSIPGYLVPIGSSQVKRLWCINMQVCSR